MSTTRGRRMVGAMLLIATMLIACLGLGGGVQAARFIQERIPVDMVIDDDVFVSGDRVVIDGTVRGDCFASAGEVVMNGTVEGSLVATGGNLRLNGQVRGSVYSAGSSVVLGSQARVGRNLYVGAYSLEAEAGSQVNKDVLVGAYQAMLRGAVGQDVRAGVGALELDGRVERDILAYVGEPGAGRAPSFTMPQPYAGPTAVEPGLRVSPEATIGGKLTYHSRVAQDAAIQAAPRGGVAYTPTEDGKGRGQPGRSFVWVLFRWLVARAREMVTLLILGALALWLAPKPLRSAIEQLRERRVPALGYGLLVWVMGYVGAAILMGLIVVIGILVSMLTLGGLASAWFGVGLSALGLICTLFLLLVSYGSKMVVALLVGRWLLRAAAPKNEIADGWALVVGVVIYALLRGIPVLGWLIGAIVTLLGLGGLWLWAQAQNIPGFGKAKPTA